MSAEVAATGSPHRTVPQTIETGGVVVAYRRKGSGEPSSCTAPDRRGCGCRSTS